jgi:hypothetical protein
LLCSYCCSALARACAHATPVCAHVATTLEQWSEHKIKSEGGRWEGGREEVAKFFGAEKRWEKTNNFGQGGCVFGSS